MKLLYVGLLPPEAGGFLRTGASTHGWDLARKAAAGGHEVAYLAPTQARRSYVREGVRVIGQPHRKWRKAWDGWRLGLKMGRREREAAEPYRGRTRMAVLGRALHLRRTVGLLKPDCVHLQAIEDGAPLSLLLQGHPVPAVATDHGYWHSVASDVDFDRGKAGLGRLNRLVAVSAFARDRAVRDGLDALVPVAVIHNPIEPGESDSADPAAVRRARGLEGKNIVFFSGLTRSLETKRLGLLLEAFRYRRELRECCRLVALADSQGAVHARRYAEKHGLDAVVRVEVSRDEARALAAAADVCAVPSRSEAFPLVFEESLAAGVPVVGFGPAVRELAGLLGTYVGEPFEGENESPDELAEKIWRVIMKAVERRPLREAFARRLSWDAQYPAYEDLYRQAVQQGPASARGGGR
jgi:glycosyltransferase involved in cell wall biosynthesis